MLDERRADSVELELENSVLELAVDGIVINAVDEALGMSVREFEALKVDVVVEPGDSSNDEVVLESTDERVMGSIDDVVDKLLGTSLDEVADDRVDKVEDELVESVNDVIDDVIDSVEMLVGEVLTRSVVDSVVDSVDII